MRQFTLRYYSKRWVLLYHRPISKVDGTLNGLFMCDTNIYTCPSKNTSESLLQGLTHFSSIELNPMFAAEANRPLRELKFVSLNEVGVELPSPPRSYPYLAFQIEDNHLTGEAHPNCPYHLYQKYDALGRYSEIWKPLDFHFETFEQVAEYLVEWMGIVRHWKVETP